MVRVPHFYTCAEYGPPDFSLGMEVKDAEEEGDQLVGRRGTGHGTIGEIVYTKAILSQIMGKRMDKVPVIIVTDSKNLEEAVYSTKLVEDPWLIPDIAIIKEAMEQGTVAAVKRVSSEDMLANCLTKQGASAEGLLTVMMRGEYSIPV